MSTRLLLSWLLSTVRSCPLGADPTSLPAAFNVLSAAGSAPKGKGEWLNTSTYIFYPQPALAGGQSFTVQIDQSLLGADGAPLEKEADSKSLPYSWTFNTASPRLVSLTPEANSTSVRLDSKVVLTFNQEMDARSVQANFLLVDPASNPVPGDFSWDTAGKVMTYTPSTLLQRNGQYLINLNLAAQAAGGTPLGQGLNTAFTTVSDLAVAGTNPPPGGITRPGAPLELTFNSYLPDDAGRFITITPTVTNLNYSVDSGLQTISLFGDMVPDTDYHVTISPDLKDIWGQALGREYTLRLPQRAAGPHPVF